MAKYKEKLIDPGKIVYEKTDSSQLSSDLKLPFSEDYSLDLGSGSSISFGSNSRCVPVGTKSITPGGCNRKKLFRAKRTDVKFRCTVYEKKLLRIKARRSRLSVSEFCRRAAFGQEIKQGMSQEHIEIYKTLVKFHNNFKSIGNMYRNRDPKLTATVYRLADEIKQHLKNFKK